FFHSATKPVPTESTTPSAALIPASPSRQRRASTARASTVERRTTAFRASPSCARPCITSLAPLLRLTLLLLRHLRRGLQEGDEAHHQPAEEPHQQPQG